MSEKTKDVEPIVQYAKPVLERLTNEQREVHEGYIRDAAKRIAGMFPNSNMPEETLVALIHDRATFLVNENAVPQEVYDGRGKVADIGYDALARLERQIEPFILNFGLFALIDKYGKDGTIPIGRQNLESESALVSTGGISPEHRAFAEQALGINAYHKRNKPYYEAIRGVWNHARLEALGIAAMLLYQGGMEDRAVPLMSDYAHLYIENVTKGTIDTKIVQTSPNASGGSGILPGNVTRNPQGGYNFSDIL